MTSYILTESLMAAIQAAATARPTSIDVLLRLHDELDKSSSLVSVPFPATNEMLQAGASANVGPRSTSHLYIFNAMIKARPSLT